MHRLLTTTAISVGFVATVAALLYAAFRAMDAWDFAMIHLTDT